MRIRKLFKQVFQRKFSNNTTAQEENQAASASASAPVLQNPEGTTLGDIRSELLSQMQNGYLVIPDGITEIPHRFFDGFVYVREKIADRIVSVFIPGTVRHIGERAFADCRNLETIILSEGIERIDDNVFTGCEKLKEIRLPASIKKITGRTFYGSGLNKPVFSADGKILIYYPKAWEDSEYAVPEGVEEIGNRAFINAKQLARLMLPQSLRRISSMTFADCKNLETIMLSEGIESIDDNVFTGCEKLKEIHLPASIKKIAEGTFCGSGLNKPVFSPDGKKLIHYPRSWKNSEYTVPEGVEEIGSRAFFRIKQLTKLTLPQSLRRISCMAFVDCSFTEIAVPDKAAIEKYAFFNFSHHIKIQHGNVLNTLEQEIEYCRIMGFPFLNAQQMKVPEERYWKEEEFCSLAKQCSVGNVNAMEKMSSYFQTKADAGERNSFYQSAACFWHVRAYQYGSAVSKQYLIDWYREHPDSHMISPGLDEKLKGEVSGELLNALGFAFFQEDREYSLSGMDEQGVVEVSSWESTEGPDEDGFGMEECYDWWYLNEYLILPEGVEYIHSYSHNDRRCNEKKFLALHDRVAELRKS